MVKKAVIIIYITLIALMGIATFVEKYKGTDFVGDVIYGSWWFSALWALGVATGIVYFVKQKIRKAYVVCLHLSFVVILLGALATHIFSVKGVIALREGQPSGIYVNEAGQPQELPFNITLKKFRVTYHEGTSAPEDYISELVINEGKDRREATVSMNKIYQHSTMRLYQKSYDEDMHGSTLLINSDPLGIPLTYMGYALLFISLIWMLVDKNGTYRKLLRSNISQRILLLGLFLAPCFSTYAQHALPRASADKFGELFIVYNDRVCPMETFARDFTKKLYGKPSYKGYSACQVLTGFMFWSKDWMSQPIMKIKGREVRNRFKLDKYVSPMRFFNSEGYILGPYLQMNTNDKFYEQVMDVDDKLMLIMAVQHMEPLEMFPYTYSNGEVKWFSPVAAKPAEMQEEQQKYIHDIIPMLGDYAVKGDNRSVDEILTKMRKYQLQYGAKSLPHPSQVWAERVYNKIPFATILFMANLTLALLSVFFLFRRRVYNIFAVLMALSFAALTFCLLLRWIISGTIPMNNGYETTLVMAWLILLVALLLFRRLRIMVTFGLLTSGFMLLVSHIGQMNPAITHRMPVLNSPLLSIHVSIIMMAYALLSLTFITSITYFLTFNIKRLKDLPTHLTWLNGIFLYPAMTFLGIGIFVGAIWANVSWGTYWGWDPKEVWALITFMVYAAVLHQNSLPLFKNPLWYHLYIAIAFFTVIMTYFGVNYFLGGMHSYA